MVRRIAVVEKEKCHPEGCGGYLCMRLCPVNRANKECIYIDEKSQKVEIEEDLCTGCGICPKRCPYDAIQIINLPEKLTSKPIHRFGKNSFQLFNLTIPKQEKVVGILGRNGIGKSTALNILNNVFTPNLGEYDEDGVQQQVIEEFSNTSLGDYFDKLYSGQIKIAYKPQRVELVRQHYSGKVKDLLKKSDERGATKKLIKELNMENLLNRDIKDLSGGELQRLAIIATCSKKADVYYFDEPTSFLDITLRVKVAKIIRDITQSGKSILIVEHDLAVLDYISDEIQIVYGSPAAYGIIVAPQSVRAGINEYLEGYIKSANMKFRPYKINFEQAQEKKEVSSEILFSYPDIEKKYPKFSIKIKGGEVHKGEIMGIMGANGLGKTTFLKLLAGLEKGESSKKLDFEICYKPQYLEAEKGLVKDILADVDRTKLSKAWYKKNVIDKLGLDRIWDSEVKKLSGGELQKVYVAKTILGEGDVYAFDEPSAFIDVEDRMVVASVIKDFVITYEKCAIVVDHDVQFIDHVSDTILVFEGTPGEKGRVFGPLDKKQGMNRVLRSLGITYRKDPVNGRARINKEGSVMDRRQKEKGEYYHS